MNYSTTYYNSNTPSGNFGVGQHVVAYVVRDASGNKDSVGFTITVIDANGPALYPYSVALTLDAAGFDTLTVAMVDSFRPIVAASTLFGFRNPYSLVMTWATQLFGSTDSIVWAMSILFRYQLL